MTEPTDHYNYLYEQASKFAERVKKVEELDAQDQAHFEQEKKLLQSVQTILQQMQEKATSLQQARKKLHEQIKTDKVQLESKLSVCDKERINKMLTAFYEAKKQTDVLMEQLEKSNRNFLQFCQIKSKHLQSRENVQ